MASKCTPQALAGGIPDMWALDGWFVVVDIAVMFFILVRGMMRTEFAVLLALMFLMASQIITTSEALAGFSSTAILAVATLYVVAEGLTSTAAIDYLMVKLLGNPKRLGEGLPRLLVPLLVFGMWINNTP